MAHLPESASLSRQHEARAIFREALERCSVEHALAAKLRTGSVDDTTPETASLRVEGVRRLLIVALGKGAAAMLRALLRREDIVAGREIVGILVSPVQPDDLPAGITFVPGAHPLPNADARRAAELVLHMLREEPADEQTLCLFLISGGASAMLEMPLRPWIGLEDIAAFHRALVHSGLPITEMNTLRKHFSAVKGGRLALVAAHLRAVSLLMSDVPPGKLDTLASGPTLPDTSTVADCLGILDRHPDLLASFPSTVRRFFDGDIPETPKPGAIAERVLLLLSQADLSEAAAQAARERGFYTVVDVTPDDWPAADAADYLLHRFRALRQQHGRVCLVSTGELAVRVPPSVTSEVTGGRNQHFVLECALRFRPEEDLTVLSCGSDGVDGNSTAAGAVVDSSDFQDDEVRKRAAAALAAFDSGTLLRRRGCTVETGPTGMNLRDLRLLLG